MELLTGACDELVRKPILGAWLSPPATAPCGVNNVPDPKCAAPTPGRSGPSDKVISAPEGPREHPPLRGRGLISGTLSGNGLPAHRAEPRSTTAVKSSSMTPYWRLVIRDFHLGIAAR